MCNKRIRLSGGGSLCVGPPFSRSVLARVCWPAICLENPKTVMQKTKPPRGDGLLWLCGKGAVLLLLLLGNRLQGHCCSLSPSSPWPPCQLIGAGAARRADPWVAWVALRLPWPHHPRHEPLCGLWTQARMYQDPEKGPAQQPAPDHADHPLEQGAIAPLQQQAPTALMQQAHPGHHHQPMTSRPPLTAAAAPKPQPPQEPTSWTGGVAAALGRNCCWPWHGASKDGCWQRFKRQVA